MGWDEAVAGLRGVGRTFTGITYDVPVGAGRGRRPVTNGHLIRAPTLAANFGVDVLLFITCHWVKIPGTFKKSAMTDAKRVRTTRPELYRLLSR